VPLRSRGSLRWWALRAEGGSGDSAGLTRLSQHIRQVGRRRDVVSTAGPGTILAMTTNASRRLSLDPPPMLVSVDKRTRTHQLLPGTRRYSLSALAAEQGSAGDALRGPPSGPATYTMHRSGARLPGPGPRRPLVFHAGEITGVAIEPVIASWGW